MAGNHIRILKALSDPTRLRIMEILEKGEVCACELPERVGKSQPNVSLHLKTLKDAGLVKSRKEGKRIMYSVAKPEILKVIESLKKIE